MITDYCSIWNVNNGLKDKFHNRSTWYAGMLCVVISNVSSLVILSLFNISMWEIGRELWHYFVFWEMGSKLLGKLGGFKLYYIPQIDNVDCYVYFLQIDHDLYWVHDGFVLVNTTKHNTIRSYQNVEFEIFRCNSISRNLKQIVIKYM